MRKALFIGGTGTISMAITRQLAREGEWELWLVNRGSREKELPEGVKILGDLNVPAVECTEAVEAPEAEEAAEGAEPEVIGRKKEDEEEASDKEK